MSKMDASEGCEPNIEGYLKEGYLQAMCGTRKAGYVSFVLHDDGSILLSDIQVFDEAIIPPGWLARWIPRRRPKTICYRNRGIGSALMSKFLQLADEAGVERIYGSVTFGDIEVSPFLEYWYPSLGFVFLPPDHECVPNAKHKIERVLRIQL
jgi:hypothetical protein